MSELMRARGHGGNTTFSAHRRLGRDTPERISEVRDFIFYLFFGQLQVPLYPED